MVHQLRISLNGLEPEIWRSFKINSDSNFHDLHLIIQTVMGWENDHLYEFENKDYRIGIEPEDAFFTDGDLISADSITIKDVLLKKKSIIIYNYDFGDSWEHKIIVEDILKDEILLNPICIAGAMSCPPEDCGGIWGYINLLEIIKDKKHPERDDMLEWLGGDFDPNYFNLEKLNKTLSKFKIKKKKK